MAEPPVLPLLLTTLEATATIAFALSGLLEAARKRLDAVGVCVVAGLAAFGGVLRDVVCNEIPSAFRDHRPYAVCAFAGGWVLVGTRALGVDDSAALLLAAGAAFGLRAAALATDFRLPAWRPDGEP